jgi:hypothetical protein
MTKEALGKGRAAIFEGLSPATSSQQPVTGDSLPAESKKPPVTSNKSPATSYQHKIDKEILAQALSEAKRSPKITVFSPMVSAVLRYKQLTTVRYSFSTEAGERLEKAIKDAYPDVWEEVEKALAKK